MSKGLLPRAFLVLIFAFVFLWVFSGVGLAQTCSPPCTPQIVGEGGMCEGGFYKVFQKRVQTVCDKGQCKQTGAPVEVPVRQDKCECGCSQMSGCKNCGPCDSCQNSACAKTCKDSADSCGCAKTAAGCKKCAPFKLEETSTKERQCFSDTEYCEDWRTYIYKELVKDKPCLNNECNYAAAPASNYQPTAAGAKYVQAIGNNLKMCKSGVKTCGGPSAKCCGCSEEPVVSTLCKGNKGPGFVTAGDCMKCLGKNTCAQICTGQDTNCGCERCDNCHVVGVSSSISPGMRGNGWYDVSNTRKCMDGSTLCSAFVKQENRDYKCTNNAQKTATCNNYVVIGSPQEKCVSGTTKCTNGCDPATLQCKLPPGCEKAGNLGCGSDAGCAIGSAKFKLSCKNSDGTTRTDYKCMPEPTCPQGTSVTCSGRCCPARGPNSFIGIGQAAGCNVGYGCTKDPMCCAIMGGTCTCANGCYCYALGKIIGSGAECKVASSSQTCDRLCGAGVGFKCSSTPVSGWVAKGGGTQAGCKDGQTCYCNLGSSGQPPSGSACTPNTFKCEGNNQIPCVYNQNTRKYQWSTTKTPCSNGCDTVTGKCKTSSGGPPTTCDTKKEQWATKFESGKIWCTPSSNAATRRTVKTLQRQVLEGGKCIFKDVPKSEQYDYWANSITKCNGKGCKEGVGCNPGAAANEKPCSSYCSAGEISRCFLNINSLPTTHEWRPVGQVGDLGCPLITGTIVHQKCYCGKLKPSGKTTPICAAGTCNCTTKQFCIQTAVGTSWNSGLFDSMCLTKCPSGGTAAQLDCSTSPGAACVGYDSAVCSSIGANLDSKKDWTQNPKGKCSNGVCSCGKLKSKDTPPACDTNVYKCENNILKRQFYVPATKLCSFITADICQTGTKCDEAQKKCVPESSGTAQLPCTTAANAACAGFETSQCAPSDANLAATHRWTPKSNGLCTSSTCYCGNKIASKPCTTYCVMDATAGGASRGECGNSKPANANYDWTLQPPNGKWTCSSGFCWCGKPKSPGTAGQKCDSPKMCDCRYRKVCMENGLFGTDADFRAKCVDNGGTCSEPGKPCYKPGSCDCQTQGVCLENSIIGTATDYQRGCVATGICPSCQDSDGRNFDVAGVCKDRNGERKDTCIDSTTARDWICQNSICFPVYQTCTGSCVGGKCSSGTTQKPCTLAPLCGTKDGKLGLYYGTPFRGTDGKCYLPSFKECTCSGGKCAEDSGDGTCPGRCRKKMANMNEKDICAGWCGDYLGSGSSYGCTEDRPVCCDKMGTASCSKSSGTCENDEDCAFLKSRGCSGSHLCPDCSGGTCVCLEGNACEGADDGGTSEEGSGEGSGGGDSGGGSGGDGGGVTPGGDSGEELRECNTVCGFKVGKCKDGCSPGDDHDTDGDPWCEKNGESGHNNCCCEEDSGEDSGNTPSDESQEIDCTDASSRLVTKRVVNGIESCTIECDGRTVTCHNGCDEESMRCLEGEDGASGVAAGGSLICCNPGEQDAIFSYDAKVKPRAVTLICNGNKREARSCPEGEVVWHSKRLTYNIEKRSYCTPAGCDPESAWSSSSYKFLGGVGATYIYSNPSCKSGLALVKNYEGRPLAEGALLEEITEGEALKIELSSPGTLRLTFICLEPFSVSKEEIQVS